MNRMWQAFSDEFEGVTLFHEMRAGDLPLLMVHGVGPGTTGRANFGPLLERLSQHFAYANHVPYLEQPQAFDAAFLPFLQKSSNVSSP